MNGGWKKLLAAVSLKGVAGEARNSLFPEGVSRLSKNHVLRRWKEVEAQLAGHPNKEKIFRS